MVPDLVLPPNCIHSNKLLKRWYEQTAGFIPPNWKARPAVQPERSKMETPTIASELAAGILEQRDDRSPQPHSEGLVLHDFRSQVPQVKTPAQEYKTSEVMHLVELQRITKRNIETLTALAEKIDQATAMLKKRSSLVESALDDHANYIVEIEKFTEVVDKCTDDFLKEFGAKYPSSR